MLTQAEKAVIFQALHQQPRVFVIGNPWDAGSARILTSLGYQALSTTSAGLAFTLGRRDGTRSLSRAEALANARSIVEATNLPVAADLENGYGDKPEDAAETIRLAAEAGLVGGSSQLLGPEGTELAAIKGNSPLCRVWLADISPALSAAVSDVQGCVQVCMGNDPAG